MNILSIIILKRTALSIITLSVLSNNYQLSVIYQVIFKIRANIEIEIVILKKIKMF